MSATHSAVIVAIPEAEPVVAGWRDELDPAAPWGVPAHVTALYPFLAPDAITEQTISELAAAVATVASFDVVFARAAWFDDTVLWLAPEPDAPFRALTAAVWARFPECPPYAGEFAEVIPHLTIGDRGPRARLDAAAQSVSQQLPIRARVARAALISGSHTSDSWGTVAEFPLGR